MSVELFDRFQQLKAKPPWSEKGQTMLEFGG